MNTPNGPAAPESGTSDDIRDFATPAADPAIAALLAFVPVPRKISHPNAWTAELQREFIARLAAHGSIAKACAELGRDPGGVRKLYHASEGAGFRDAWHAAIALAKARRAERIAAQPGARPGGTPPSLDNRRKSAPDRGPGPGYGHGEEGQVMNEYGEWEDEQSYRERGEEAKDSIGNKLVRARRRFLCDIAAEPVKRAAFEILTELPIDWDKAERMEPQEFEPLLRTNQLQPDMILTAESGWSFGDIGYGPDRQAELLRDLNEWRAEQGLEPLAWGSDE